MSSLSNQILRNYTDVYIEQAITVYVNAIVKGIKKEILLKAYRDSKQEQDLQKQPSLLSFHKNEGMMHKLKIDFPYRNIQGQPGEDINLIYSLVPHFNPKSLIPRVIDGIKVEFPEMNIQIDPLQTYILLDWSQ